MSEERTPGFNTLAIHAGAQPDPATGARVTPIYQTTSYVFDDVDHAAALFNLETFGNIYTRIMNPTQAVLEERLAALEGGTAALAVASGHAAQALVFHTLLEPGDEFIAARQLYGGSINQFGQAFAKCGWTVKWADTTDAESFRAQLSPKTRAIFVESIANPGGIITDLAAIAAVAKEAGVPFIVDNTLATPYLTRPKEYGADIIVHSLTKFLGGHGNSIGGAIVDCGTFDWIGSGRYPSLTAPCPELSRHYARRDVRQFCLRHCRPSSGPSRSRPGDRPDERFSHSHRHRDAAVAHAAPLRQRTASGDLAQRPRQGRLGELCGARRQPVLSPHPSAIALMARARCSPLD